jgi:hypothetical protein
MFSDLHIAPADCSIWCCPDLRVERRCRRTTSKVHPSRSRRLVSASFWSPALLTFCVGLSSLSGQEPNAPCAPVKSTRRFPDPPTCNRDLLLLTE